MGRAPSCRSRGPISTPMRTSGSSGAFPLTRRCHPGGSPVASGTPHRPSRRTAVCWHSCGRRRTASRNCTWWRPTAGSRKRSPTRNWASPSFPGRLIRAGLCSPRGFPKKAVTERLTASEPGSEDPRLITGNQYRLNGLGLHRGQAGPTVRRRRSRAGSGTSRGSRREGRQGPRGRCGWPGAAGGAVDVRRRRPHLAVVQPRR